MRRLLALVLCLLMPLQGFASLQAAETPCPLQGMMAMDVDAGDKADAMEDCCNDAATFEQTGQACKTGQSCTAPAAWMSPYQPVEFQAQVSQAFRAAVWRPAPSGEPTRHWRPPASV